MTRIVQALLSIALLLWTPWVSAASARGGEGESTGADAQLRAMVARLTMENSQLKTAAATAKQELAALEKDLNQSEAETEKKAKSEKALKVSLAREKRRSDSAIEQNTELRTRLDELAERFRALAETLKASEERGATLASLSQDFEARVSRCESNNEDLHTLVNEVADKYQQRGFFRSLREREPFLQLKRAEVENMMAEYRQIAEDMRLKYGDGDEEGPTVSSPEDDT